MRTIALIPAGLTALLLTQLGPDFLSAQVSRWEIRVTPIESPATSPSGQPQLTASSKGVLLSWVERSGSSAALKFSERTLTGWTAPRTVASGDDWFVNWADVPSVVRLPNGSIVGHWLQKSGPETYAYDVRLAYSSDGRTFSESFLPHHDASKTEHGFASLFPFNSGLGLVWLDGRLTSQTSGGHGSGGAMTLRYAAFDRNWKQVADMQIDERVCDCCPTTAAITSDGPIVAFRDRSDHEIRDIHISRLENGKWTESIAVAHDNWQINACPVNGPMLAARGRDVVLVWYTAANNQTRAFAAFSRDAGRTFGPPTRIDEIGTLGRVDVELLEDGSAVASWIEYAARSAEFRIRRIQPAGGRSAPVTIATVRSDRLSGYPRLASHENELVMAWLEPLSAQATGSGNQMQLKTAVAILPK